MMSASRPDSRWLSELKIFVGLQIFTLPLIISIFRFVEPRILAAVLAGTWFCLLGSLMSWRSGVVYRRWKSPVFVTSIFFALAVAYPMLIVRALNFSADFSLLSIWGIPSSVFHRLSNFFFLAVLAASVYEWVHLRTLQKSASADAPKA